MNLSRNARVAVFVVVMSVLAVPASAAGGAGRSSERKLTEAGEGAFEVLERADQYAEARTAPAETVDAGAFTAAYQAALALPVVGAPWHELTPNVYNSDAQGYRDPVWSNSGGGAGHVSGRATALAQGLDGTLYVGTADGGIWRSPDGGGTWQPLFDDSPTLSIGALAVNPAGGDLWVGTGEASTSSDSYAGTGILRSTDGGATFQRVGGAELENHLVRRLVFDGRGAIYAATSKGLYKHSAGTNAGAWSLLLKPCVGQHDTTYISDVDVRPGTNGQTVVAVVGWRAGSACNGFYQSTDAGATFTPQKLSGAINESQLGRTTLAFTPTGGRLYAVVQSAQLFNHPSTLGGGTVLMGVFVSKNGASAGSWTKLAEARNLATSGSALKGERGYQPGVQAWYNQFLVVDPADANHLYLGLEEVFESTDGGVTWKAVGPYWNFGLPCAQASLDDCPPTTHPDQHDAIVTPTRVYIADDGGVYSRARTAASGWANHNSGLRTLQYYYAGAGHVAGGDAVWGGLQDNGESLLLPGSSMMVSPFGGDGGDTLVDPANGDRAVVEYVGLDMALTTNGGRSDGTTPSFREISPACGAFTYTPDPCDPTPRFIAPFRADVTNLNHWVAGGQYVWDNGGKGWDTTCGPKACDWSIVHDTGAGRSITAIAVHGATTYVGWCGPCNAPTFQSGIDTNAGGTWHTISSSILPNRFVNALTVDPANAAHVYAVYNGFSRRWTNDGGFGHVFESTNGATTWTDISGNLPDIPGDDLLVAKGKLVLAADLGAYVAAVGGGTGTAWSRFGSALPNASVNDLTLDSAGANVIAATHGRGLWTQPLP